MEILLLYGKRSKILKTFLFLFSNKMLVFRAGIRKILARIANREDPDQYASLSSVIWVCTVCVGLFQQATNVQSVNRLSNAY